MKQRFAQGRLKFLMPFGTLGPRADEAPVEAPKASNGSEMGRGSRLLPIMGKRRKLPLEGLMAEPRPKTVLVQFSLKEHT